MKPNLDVSPKIYSGIDYASTYQDMPSSVRRNIKVYGSCLTTDIDFEELYNALESISEKHGVKKERHHELERYIVENRVSLTSRRYYK